ncbi:MAG: hypothetical protein NC225_01635 [Clostridium sp.]|nr:hypothetical protein [Clostridium sp.]MCM1398162.1 hypothetical protein [Clostridium sp.]MCM1460838.1 hypothetical protein [Bacteroides sp.]
MGRSGGGGGGHHSSGHSGGSHHGSSHHSYGGSSRGGSSFHSGGGGGHNRPPSWERRPSYNHPPRHYNYGPRYRDYGPGMPPPPPPRRRYYGSSGSSGCGIFVVMIIIFVILGCMSLVSGGGGTVTDSNLSEYAEQQYQKIFNGREDCLLIVLDDQDNGQIKYGARTNSILDYYNDTLWDTYDRHYNDDLGIQLKGMFVDTADKIAADGVAPLNADKGFDSHCYRDDINWVDTKGNLQDGAKYFYDKTGIQPYVLLVKSKTIAKATNKSSGVLKVLIIAVAAIIILLIAFKWWKKRTAQKNKEQEDLERTLSTPLETFGSETSDLEKKYDDDPTNDP